MTSVKVALFGALLAYGGTAASEGAWRDSESAPRPYVIAVRDGWDPQQGDKSYYFKMSPDPAAPFDLERGFGFAYEAAIGEADKLLWKTSGWYAWRVFVARDGPHLVRIGNWPKGTGPAAEHLAIAFYDSGKLVKSYSPLDLIKDPTAVRRSVSHYEFQGAGKAGFVHAEEKDIKNARFRLPLSDRSTCVFDVTDGRLVSQQ